MSDRHDHCNCPISSSSVCQTLDELDFERGIWYAAQNGDLARVEKLLEKDTSVDARDMAGYTALHYAARSGHSAVCRRLLAAGACVDAVTRAGKATALHRATSAGCADVVELLRETGAKLEVRDGDGRTALHRAALGGHVDIAKLLLKANPNLKHLTDLKEKIPLQYANNNKQLEVLLALP